MGKTGKRYPPETREQAIQMYMINNSYNATAKELGVALSTVKRWVLMDVPTEQIAEIRNQNRAEFAERAGEIITKALDLVDRRISTALDNEVELNSLIADVYSGDASDDTAAGKKKLADKIKDLQLQRLGDITTALGTLYDKRALAVGEATSNEAVKVEFFGLAKDLAE